MATPSSPAHSPDPTDQGHPGCRLGCFRDISSPILSPDPAWPERTTELTIVSGREFRDVRLGAAAWYGDDEVAVRFPIEWEVEEFWPELPPELNDDQIVGALRNPLGQGPLRELAGHFRRPAIVVDDP